MPSGRIEKPISLAGQKVLDQWAEQMKEWQADEIVTDEESGFLHSCGLPYRLRSSWSYLMEKALLKSTRYQCFALLLLLSAATASAQYVAGYNHSFDIGQSLCVGTGGTPPISTTQPYANLTPTSFLSTLTLVPLTSTALGAVTSSADLENPIPGRVDNARFFDPSARIQVASKHCVSGADYTQLKKGTSTYNATLTTITGVINRATDASLPYKTILMSATHGGADVGLKRTAAQYQHYLREWQSDYNTDINSFTGQTGTIPMFISQFVSVKSENAHRYPVMDRDLDTVANTAMQGTPDPEIGTWWAMRDYPGTIYTLTQRYPSQFTYSSGPHLDENGYLKLGAYLGKYQDRIIRQGLTTYRGVTPRRITRSGATVEVQFWVPVDPLVIDTTTVSNPGQWGFRFSQVGGNGALTFTAATIKSGTTDTVQLTLSATPTGTNQIVGYGVDSSIGTCRGNIRDSDTTTSREGILLQNWGISWMEPIGFKWEPESVVPLKIQPSYVATTTGTQFTLTAVDGVSSYTFGIPAGCSTVSSTATSVTAQCGSAALYDFTLTDSDTPGQIRHATVSVTGASSALAITPSSQTKYSGETANWTATGGTSPYAWTAPAGCSPTSGSGFTFAVVCPVGGPYTIGLTDAAAGSTSGSLTILSVEAQSSIVSGKSNFSGKVIVQ